MKTGALGLPGYRTFSLEELEEATNNFDTSAFMGEGSHGQVGRPLLTITLYLYLLFNELLYILKEAKLINVEGEEVRNI